jgi:hypothetical protein
MANRRPREREREYQECAGYDAHRTDERLPGTGPYHVRTDWYHARTDQNFLDQVAGQRSTTIFFSV